jgi:uncharacterized protein YacL
MLRIALYAVYLVVCAGAFGTYVNAPSSIKLPPFVRESPFVVFLLLMLLSQVVPIVDLIVRRKRIEIISAIYFGALVGTLLAFLTMQALGPIIQTLAPGFESAAQTVVSLMLIYGCISLLLQTKDDFRFVIPYVEFARELKGGTPLVLDSSALIDGRIADVVETRILDSDVVVPQFVLHEVQEIADSRDKTRRTRGRRGLEVLGKLQNSPHVDVRVQEQHGSEFEGMTVDQRLVELAKKLGGRIVTSDYNLNKVASLQGVPVVNLNDVANSLKPRFLPGERLKLTIIKEGESAGQGVGYLDDGTMVVVEQTAHLIGQNIDLIVTSVLQSSAGRMIFGRQVFQAASETETDPKSTPSTKSTPEQPARAGRAQSHAKD